MNENIEKPTFKQIVLLNIQQLTNFPYIEKDFDALTDYGLLCKIVDKMNEVITDTNKQDEAIINLYNAFVALKDFVDNYFDNLDVQEEINNKLEEMASDGTLQEIVASYLETKAIFGFDTVEDMKQATNLIKGSFARTLGYYEINDGGGATYKITDEESETEYQEELESGLFANLISNNKILNIKQIGAYGNNENDDTNVFIKAINFVNTNHINLFIPIGEYLISDDLPDLYTGIQIIGEISTNKFINASVIHDVRNSTNFLFNIKNLENENTITGGGIKYLTIYYDGNNSNACCIFLNEHSAGYVGVIEEVKIQGYATAIKSISNDYRYLNCQILLCGNLNHYAIHLSGGANENKFSGCHIEHCRYAIKVDESSFLNSFENGKIEMSKRNMSYNELSSPIVISSNSTQTPMAFINTSFINLDISAYSNEENSSFKYSDVPYMIESSSLGLIISDCKFTCGLGSGEWTHNQNKQSKYLKCSYGNITNNYFDKVSYITHSILSYFVNLSNNSFVVESGGSYNCEHDNIQSIVHNNGNQTNISNNYFLGKYATPYSYFSNEYKLNTDTKKYHLNSNTSNGQYNTLVIKPTKNNANLTAMLFVYLTSFYNKTSGYFTLLATHISNTSYIKVQNSENINIIQNYPVYISIKDGIIYVQIISDGNNFYFDVKGIEGQEYTAYVDSEITTLISEYDLQRVINV